uniref:Sister chromatid cohesion protein PDS5 homolog A n=1 Tax=Rhizophora mucronata TaxID=61149 RepID=A0A2P2LSQ9_RHIMU
MNSTEDSFSHVQGRTFGPQLLYQSAVSKTLKI